MGPVRIAAYFSRPHGVRLYLQDELLSEIQQSCRGANGATVRRESASCPVNRLYRLQQESVSPLRVLLATFPVAA